MLLILSPASVKSRNVRNEIAYALDKQKNIIPVLYKDCAVPLQLHRIQHIDFRVDYLRGLKALLKSLGVQQQPQQPGTAASSGAPAASKLDVSNADGHKRAAYPAGLQEERRQARHKKQLEQERTVAAESTSGSRLWAFLTSGVGILLLSSILVAGLGGFFTYWTQYMKEKQARVQEEEKLLAEFDFRLKELQTRITEINSAGNVEDKGALTVYIWRAAHSGSDYQPTKPEFKNVRWSDIIIQLANLGIFENSEDAVTATRDLENAFAAGAISEGGSASPMGYNVFPFGYLEERERILRNYSEKAWKKVGPKRISNVPLSGLIRVGPSAFGLGGIGVRKSGMVGTGAAGTPPLPILPGSPPKPVLLG